MFKVKLACKKSRKYLLQLGKLPVRSSWTVLQSFNHLKLLPVWFCTTPLTKKKNSQLKFRLHFFACIMLVHFVLYNCCPEKRSNKGNTKRFHPVSINSFFFFHRKRGVFYFLSLPHTHTQTDLETEEGCTACERGSVQEKEEIYI